MKTGDKPIGGEAKSVTHPASKHHKTFKGTKRRAEDLDSRRVFLKLVGKEYERNKKRVADRETDSRCGKRRRNIGWLS